MKVCSKCKNNKPLIDFHRNKISKDGHCNYCKICSKEAANAYNRKNIKDVRKRSKRSAAFLRRLIDLIRTKYGCSFCLEREACCLDFHHLDDNKSEEVSILITKKKRKEVFEEINKCIVVCANCHRKIHKGLLDCSDKQLCKENFSDYFEEREGRFYKKENMACPMDLGTDSTKVG